MRYTGPSCRQCRREGTKLFLKGSRCLTEKCAVERRGYPPGQHGQSGGRVRKVSEYAKQLREKQKVKRIYGLTERQFRNTFDRISRESGVKGTNLLIALESRLDNVVFRLGFANSRSGARQLVAHGHVQVNGRKVDVSSFNAKAGDTITIKDKPQSRRLAARNLELTQITPVPDWLSVDKDNFKGAVSRIPTREEIAPIVNEQLIVELYSR